MGFLRNLLALLGLVVLVAGGVLYSKAAQIGSAMDPDAQAFYKELVSRFFTEDGQPGALGQEQLQVALQTFADAKPMLEQFDPGFVKTYREFGKLLLESGDPGTAMVWVVKVKDGISADDVIESMKSLATEKRFMYVSSAPFYKQVEALTGQPFRHVSFHSFCDAMVGKRMLEHNPAYTAFMPCRIAVVEDTQGALWLTSMNLDMMIHGGKRLPEDLRSEAIRIRNVIWEIMQGAAAGEF
ncbi:MAG: DUF302 domain-containing protein [Magnetococcus sp. WYHC-3]